MSPRIIIGSVTSVYARGEVAFLLSWKDAALECNRESGSWPAALQLHFTTLMHEYFKQAHAYRDSTARRAVDKAV